MQLFNGIFFHGVGASSAALCYTPEKKIRGWSWQTYWLAQAAVCWLLLPVIVAMITIPSLATVLKEAPASAMRNSFLLGMAYGIGGTAFGIAIRYIGFSLTYAISVGLSCILGTLLPPIVQGTITDVISGRGGGWIIAGVFLGALGIACCGGAGWFKEKTVGGKQNSFSLKKGLPLCILSGILSAFYGFAINAGKPISDIAAGYGAGNFQVNVVYLFSNSGAFLTTLLYMFYLHNKNSTWRQYARPGVKGALPVNYLMAVLTGLFWYGQFFFYGLGHVQLGRYEFSSWAIHMILLVFFSSVVGLVLKEWKGTTGKAKATLVSALLVLLLAVIILTYGNYLGGTGS
ncbi:rhamnose:proton symporter [Niabella ginsenosidivorans]|uniref:Rhamnose:proton symporter n=1 Tax=Niabella ginsenosidivorans TaxID=1176587 RepID=A0A1A9I0N6_9BACT|nr:L-rhamnose/proton symporter RhaT [Niabella ginsenosidivorans]ANH80252.1 rhamnose:proton symporter [Niabella ginsenosidivorans]